MLKVTYGREGMIRAHFSEGYKRFKEGREDMNGLDDQNFLLSTKMLKEQSN
jgi:hypothetical protein